MPDCILDPKTLALVALAANIAANHPKMGLCQLERLRSYGVPEAQIDQVVDIAHHLRDEAGQMLDHEFDKVFAPTTPAGNRHPWPHSQPMAPATVHPQPKVIPAAKALLSTRHTTTKEPLCCLRDGARK